MLVLQSCVLDFLRFQIGLDLFWIFRAAFILERPARRREPALSVFSRNHPSFKITLLFVQRTNHQSQRAGLGRKKTTTEEIMKPTPMHSRAAAGAAKAADVARNEKTTVDEVDKEVRKNYCVFGAFFCRKGSSAFSRHRKAHGFFLLHLINPTERSL